MQFVVGSRAMLKQSVMKNQMVKFFNEVEENNAFISNIDATSSVE